ncbi:MAG: hypothetical protein HOH74_28440 [Gemmatimonadetes bacterium]|nr:hypothetical protein [Gemmatimonadota bacterium]
MRWVEGRHACAELTAMLQVEQGRGDQGGDGHILGRVEVVYTDNSAFVSGLVRQIVCWMVWQIGGELARGTRQGISPSGAGSGSAITADAQPEYRLSEPFGKTGRHLLVLT